MNSRLDPKVIGITIALVVAYFAFNRRQGLWNGPGAEPEIMSFDENDAEMNAAMEEARASVDTFIQALQTPDSPQEYMSIKVGFHDANGDEFMWLNNVKFHEGSFRGSVGNDPEIVASVRFGDPVDVPKDQIADWMFIEDGKLVGGYTMRVMRNRLSPEERAEFDQQVGFTID